MYSHVTSRFVMSYLWQCGTFNVYSPTLQVLFLLKQLKTSDSSCGDPAVTDTELRERLVFQTGEIERLGSLQERFEQKTNECNSLKKVRRLFGAINFDRFNM